MRSAVSIARTPSRSAIYDDGSLGEVFINGGKSGEVVEAIARDGAVLLSLALQYGADLSNIRSAITRDSRMNRRA